MFSSDPGFFPQFTNMQSGVCTIHSLVYVNVHFVARIGLNVKEYPLA